jgi:protein SCO1
VIASPGPPSRRLAGSHSTSWVLLLVVLAVAVGPGCAAPTHPATVRHADEAGYRAGTSLPNPYELPDQTLTDDSGRPYNLRTSPAKPVLLLFFGYLNCPDVCSAVLSEVTTALERGPAGVRDHVQVIFVTTDPARDTPRKIAAYLDRFDESFVGLTGDLKTIKNIAGQVGVDISGQEELPSGGYHVGHSAQVIGFDAERRGVVVWAPNHAVADLKHDYQLLVERAR